MGDLRGSISRRDFLKAAGAALGALLLAPSRRAWGSAPGAVTTLTRVQTTRPVFFLTIDDGWYPDSLLAMLDILAQHQAQATFFLVGNAVQVAEGVYPGILAQLLRAGHQVGYHTLAHRRASQLALNSVAWFLQDYDRWLELMKTLLADASLEGGIVPYARAPGGYFSPNFLSLCSLRQLQPVSWNHTVDNTGPGKPRLGRGDILLMHTTPEDTRLLQQYLEDLDQVAQESLRPALFDFSGNSGSAQPEPPAIKKKFIEN